MAENPGNGDAVWRGVVFLSQTVQDFIQLRIFLASDEDSLEHTILEWRPGLNRDIFQAAVFQNAAVPVTAFVIIHVDIQSCIDRRTMGYRKLDLVDFNGSFCCLV